MCGIVGVWGHGDVNTMLDALSHRGPDGIGVYRGETVQLGAQTLKITDPDGDSQPFFNEDRSMCVVLNGEIYNYKEIRSRLYGHTFRTNTDTEVIVHAYEEYGLDCVRLFNGCFAFALWDGQRLILARDRMGQKPLYYYHHQGRFIFASEIKSILTQVDVDIRITDSFRAFETPVGDETLFEHISVVPRASVLFFNGVERDIECYWHLPNEVEQRSEKQWIEKLRWLIEDSVRLRTPRTEPFGIFLSGGLDSSLLAYLAKPHHAFTCHYPEAQSFNELAFAEGVAHDLNIPLHCVQPTVKDFETNFETILWHCDQPLATASPLSAFMLAKEASNYVRVILNGEGADELFSGYIRYMVMLLGSRIVKEPTLKQYKALVNFFIHGGVPADTAERYYKLSQRGKPVGNEPWTFFENIFSSHPNSINSMAACDIDITLPPLLTMADRVCGAFGIENRSPFLDHRIVEYAFSLPPDMKIKDTQTKYILRAVARGIVPDAIINRKDKQGLITPVQQWLVGPLQVWKTELMAAFEQRGLLFERGIRRGAFDRYEYMVISLELWMRAFSRSLSLVHNGSE